MSMTVPSRPSRRCASPSAGTMSPCSIQHRDQEKIATSNVDEAVCRELAERGPAEHDAAHEFRRQVVFCVGVRGRERLDGGDVCRPIGVAPGQATIAAADLEDAAAIEVDEIEQRPDFVLLGIDPYRHLFRSCSVGARDAACSRFYAEAGLSGWLSRCPRKRGPLRYAAVWFISRRQRSRVSRGSHLRRHISYANGHSATTPAAAIR